MELKKNYPLIKCRLDGYCRNYQDVRINFLIKLNIRQYVKSLIHQNVIVKYR